MVPCICLVAGGLALLALVGILAEALNITSKSQLEDAVVKGEAHLVLTEHLDLREPASLLRYYPGSNGATPLGVLEASTYLRTIRGDCSRPPGTTVAELALQPLRPGQCVIITASPLLGEFERNRPLIVWIDNVYLRIERDASHVAVAHHADMFNLFNKQRIWLTRSTVQGDRVVGGSFAAFTLTDGPGVFIDDVLITDVSRQDLGAVATAVESTFAAHNSTFQRIRGTSDSRPYLLHLAGGSTAAMLVGRNVSFTDNDVDNAILRVDISAVVYGNTSIEAEVQYLNGALVPLEPAENAPEGLFMGMEGDEYFEDYVLEGSLPISAGPSMASPAQEPEFAVGPGAEAGGPGESSLSPGNGGTPIEVVSGIVTGAIVLTMATVAGIIAYAARRRRRGQVTGRKWSVDGVGHVRLRASLPLSSSERKTPLMSPGAPHALQDTTDVWKLPRPVPPGKTTVGSMTSIDLGTTALATRSDAPPLDDATALERSLDRAHHAGCQILGRYLSLGCAERCSGGQGCVQFVRDNEANKDYAVKFFLQRDAFDREAELYQQEGLKAMMPATIKMCKNEDGTHVGPDGFRFPPFIIIERGESLVGWQRRWKGKYEIATALQALIHIASRLKDMHEAGWVHMDLKPNNVLWLPQQHAWSLIDFGCTATAGKEAPLAFTLAYAAPEMIAAYEARQRTVVVEPSADIWSFGLIAYEMFTDSVVFEPGTPRNVIADALMGRTSLPWEAAGGDGKPTGLARLRAFRSSVMQCLSRDATKRPSIVALLDAWYRVFDAHATTLSAVNAQGKTDL